MQKEASEIDVGDIVFCQVQPSQQFYAHIVHDVQHCYYRQEPKYWIGNIQQRFNGWCHREHIFGILVEVEVWWEDTEEGRYHSRPHPKELFERVQAMVKDDRWSSEAAKLCEPCWKAPINAGGAQSSGQLAGWNS